MAVPRRASVSKSIRAGLRSGDSCWHFADVRVDQLTEADASELAAAAIEGNDPEADSLTWAIVREAQGNAYFLLELARQARSSAGCPGRAAGPAASTWGRS